MKNNYTVDSNSPQSSTFCSVNSVKSSDSRRVLILLATHNGSKWIDEQINSIIVQEAVEVSILASDDASVDGTYEKLALWPIVTLLTERGPYGSAGRNFFHLLSCADFSNTNFVAFSDQDDIWQPTKLVRAIFCMERANCDGYSSNVIAFWGDGREVLLDKSQPQNEFDYIFEGPGPGCTYVMSAKLAKSLQDVLLANHQIAEEVALHDWYAYAVARSRGFGWFIDKEPTMRYRQHESNELGANVGYKLAIARLRRIRSGWYRAQVESICRITGNESHPLLRKVLRKTWAGRISLALHAINFRRRFRDALALSVISLIGWF